LEMKVGPVLSGIRAMKREVFDTVPLPYQARFKIEASLNFFCSRAGFRQRQTVIYNLGHLIKENKHGLMRGLSGRWDMVREVFLLHWDLYVFETWRSDTYKSQCSRNTSRTMSQRPERPRSVPAALGLVRVRDLALRRRRARAAPRGRIRSVRVTRGAAR